MDWGHATNKRVCVPYSHVFGQLVDLGVSVTVLGIAGVCGFGAGYVIVGGTLGIMIRVGMVYRKM